MVTHINFAVEDSTAEEAKDMKDRRDLSWPEFLETAVEEMDNE